MTASSTPYSRTRWRGILLDVLVCAVVSSGATGFLTYVIVSNQP